MSAAPPLPSDTAPAAAGVKGGVGASTQRSVRRSMYAAFLVLAAVALSQAWYARYFEGTRAADADILDAAGDQRTFTQQMGRLAAMAGGDAPVMHLQAELLVVALDQSRSDALRVEALVAGQLKEGENGAAVQQALDRWQAARERLWYRCEALVAALDDADAERVASTAARVQIESDPALRAAGLLAERLREAARARSETQVRLLEGGVGVTLLLLGLLALTVVEPTARAVRDQVRRLSLQADELERLAVVAEHTDNVVIVTDARHRVQWVNEAFVRLSGRALADAVGCHPTQLLSGSSDDPALRARMRQALRGRQGLRVELRVLGRGGQEHWIDADVQPLWPAGDGGSRSGRPNGYVFVGTDISERRALQEQMRVAARTDSLTGLPNRAVVLDRVERALEHARRHPGYGFAVLFMDFDRFKQVNDTHGHSAGDNLLRQIGRRIEQTLRPGDAVARVSSGLPTAARIGGDEFVVVLEGVHGSADVRAVADRLLRALSEPYNVGSAPVQSGVSIGIVTSEHASGSAEEVLRDADTAMYEAKRAGRGRCVLFDSSMHDRVVQALALETDLRRALRENELFVVYQPVVDLASARMVGVEALVRWRHPRRGIVPPAQFIALAEETGLIDAIGEFVLQTACPQFQRWRRELGERAPALLAVNLSRAQLQTPGLVQEVAWQLQESGMQPGELQLEVTESLAAQDQRVQATLRELKAMGVKLALDDFGTGYSSLACLHQLPVDTVKIDRSFVAHAQDVEYHRVLIEATIRVAQTLGMTTVAEGIETLAQAELMEQLRCDRGQGYLFSAPLTAEALSAWAAPAPVEARA